MAINEFDSKVRACFVEGGAIFGSGSRDLIRMRLMSRCCQERGCEVVGKDADEARRKTLKSFRRTSRNFRFDKQRGRREGVVCHKKWVVYSQRARNRNGYTSASRKGKKNHRRWRRDPPEIGKFIQSGTPNNALCLLFKKESIRTTTYRSMKQYIILYTTVQYTVCTLCSLRHAI